jgi:UDP-N-acetylglucosamine:LPS N-acetylglucosamine transferase
MVCKLSGYTLSIEIYSVVGDQPENARTVVEKEIGLTASKKDFLLEGVMFGMLEKIFENYEFYKGNAARIQESLKKLGVSYTMEVVLNHIEKLGLK